MRRRLRKAKRGVGGDIGLLEGRLGEAPGANSDLPAEYAASLALDLRGEHILSRRPQIRFLLGFGF